MNRILMPFAALVLAVVSLFAPSTVLATSKTVAVFNTGFCAAYWYNAENPTPVNAWQMMIFNKIKKAYSVKTEMTITPDVGESVSCTKTIKLSADTNVSSEVFNCSWEARWSKKPKSLTATYKATSEEGPILLTEGIGPKHGVGTFSESCGLPK